MHDHEHQPGPALFKTAVGTAITALIGLILAVASLLLFVFDLLVTPEVGALIVSFVVCGMGLTTGLMVLRHLVPRREPETLFGGSCGPIVPGAMPIELPAQKNERQPKVIAKSASRVHNDPEIAPVMKSHGSESIATRKTHDGGGIIAAIATIGMGSLVMGFSWRFLFLAVLAGGAVALVLNWSRSRQDPDISGNKIPVVGGITGAAALAGVGLVMMRFHFLRDFLLLAVGAGNVIALGLYWVHRREENSSGSFL
jgi:hypothetical protein